MDNVHLKTEIKPIAKDETKIKIFKARYKYSMVLVGLSVLGYYKNHGEDEENNPEHIESPESKIKLIFEMLSPILLPMIHVLGNVAGDTVDNDMDDVLV